MDSVLIKSTSRFACNTVAPHALSIRKPKDKDVGVNFEKNISKTAETLENKGFLPFSYACLSLKSASRYKKIIDNIGIYTVILFAMAFLLNAATSTFRGGQTDAKTMS